ncbi:MAG: hypothetical protein WBO22_10640, partial [Shewanella indica]|uniref:hypothetical protein n=1 Tax=Shewanella indica TaxID=768528 RepID=UPI003C70A603
ERGKINMMHSDSRVKEPVCLATTSLPDPCLSTYLSPRFREEPTNGSGWVKLAYKKSQRR